MELDHASGATALSVFALAIAVMSLVFGLNAILNPEDPELIYFPTGFVGALVVIYVAISIRRAELKDKDSKRRIAVLQQSLAGTGIKLPESDDSWDSQSRMERLRGWLTGNRPQRGSAGDLPEDTFHALFPELRSKPGCIALLQLLGVILLGAALMVALIVVDPFGLLAEASAPAAGVPVRA